MPVNLSLAHSSDYTFTGAVVVYTISLILLLAELATVSSNKSAKYVETKVLVGAGGPLTAEESHDAPGIVRDTSKKTNQNFSERLGRMGYSVVLVGLFLHIASLVFRGFATHRVPWGNMFEFINLACLAAMLIAVGALRSNALRPMIALALVPVVILMFVAGTYLYATAAPVMPALKSYWLVIHVSIVSVGSGVFLVAGAFSLIFIIKTYYGGGTGKLSHILNRFPDLNALDRYAYRTTIFAFPLFTMGVICGAIWAESAWGRYWGWDPKETASFIAWVVYAAYLHARATAGWKRSTAAWINLAGFAAMIVNLFVINLFTSGLHEYAGVN